ncbi:hypothetical protein BRADI_4g08465v3 [Brachypodium distachyon]|uniref:Uncharacterized protein n=1 Tax=Brachypodium distachyon TaxID=15368 RepID=A0A2K2CL96_BRADI|nr:hypothetical protein BRADI_4g08465v3 [Brachypodium distachyon]
MAAPTVPATSCSGMASSSSTLASHELCELRVQRRAVPQRGPRAQQAPVELGRVAGSEPMRTIFAKQLNRRTNALPSARRWLVATVSANPPHANRTSCSTRGGPCRRGSGSGRGSGRFRRSAPAAFQRAGGARRWMRVIWFRIFLTASPMVNCVPIGGGGSMLLTPCLIMLPRGHTRGPIPEPDRPRQPCLLRRRHASPRPAAPSRRLPSPLPLASLLPTPTAAPSSHHRSPFRSAGEVAVGAWEEGGEKK